MRHTPTKREDVEYELKCTITRRSHDPVIPRGTFVKMVHDHAAVNVYSALDMDSQNAKSTSDSLRMNEAGVGSIVEYAWEVDKYDLNRAKIDPVSDHRRFEEGRGRHLLDVYEDLWYLVAFTKGMFWCRFDWVDVVNDTADV